MPQGFITPRRGGFSAAQGIMLLLESAKVICLNLCALELVPDPGVKVLTLGFSAQQLVIGQSRHPEVTIDRATAKSYFQ
jgi:hypothetical protein